MRRSDDADRPEVSVDSLPRWSHQLTRRSDGSTLALSGELDLDCAPMLQALLFAQAESPGVKDLRVDLADVTFLDAATLRVLIRTLHHAQELGRSFTIVNPSPLASRVLTITGLDTVLARP
jgi:anti-sigma B factor antagonist